MICWIPMLIGAYSIKINEIIFHKLYGLRPGKVIEVTGKKYRNIAKVFGKIVCYNASLSDTSIDCIIKCFPMRFSKHDLSVFKCNTCFWVLDMKMAKQTCMTTVSAASRSKWLATQIWSRRITTPVSETLFVIQIEGA